MEGNVKKHNKTKPNVFSYGRGGGCIFFCMPFSIFLASTVCEYVKIYLHSHKVLKIAKEVRQFHFPVGKVCLLLCYPTLAGVTFAPFH